MCTTAVDAVWGKLCRDALWQVHRAVCRMTRVSRRVRKTTPATSFDTAAQGADFACAYEIDVVPNDGRSSEEWAREAWEGAPVVLRWFMLAGWRVVLGLRLGPRPSPEHILGWRIVHQPADETVCHLRSGFLDAYNSFRRIDDRLAWSTFVTYERPVARVLWPPTSLVHRAVVRVALRRVAS